MARNRGKKVRGSEKGYSKTRRGDRSGDRMVNPRGSSDRSDDRRDVRNDVSWYTHYPNLSIASAQFPYPYRPGMQLDLGLPSANTPYTIPGTMELRWYPTIGWSETATDPASIVCKELYQVVRKAYGAGDLLCDAPDFMVYLMALDSIFSYIASLRRVFRVLTAWTPDNYHLPDQVLQAMGVSPDVIQRLRKDRMKLWQIINELTLMSRKFTCPAVMDIMNRHFWMNDNVYTDAASVNSQMYVFHQVGFFKYKEQNMPSGDPASGLEMVKNQLFRGDNSIFWDGTKNVDITVDTLFEFGRDLIDALVAWDDAYTINGYLARAFEGHSNFIVDEMPIDQPFNPVYEPEVLMQIENSRACWAGSISLSDLAVSQNVLTNSIIHKPRVKKWTTAADNAFKVGKYNLHYLRPYLTQRSDAPTVADNLVASRLQVAFEPFVGDDTYARIVAATEIVETWYMWMSGLSFVDVPSVQAVEYGTGTTTQANDYHLLQKEGFDWHPLTIVGIFAATTGKLFTSIVAGDVHNITTMSVTDLKNMHKMCVYKIGRAHV